MSKCIITKLLKKYKGFSYIEVKNFGLNGILIDEYEKIGIHISNDQSNDENFILMIRYCKQCGITSLITDAKFDWIKYLIIYNGLEYIEL